MSKAAASLMCMWGAPRAPEGGQEPESAQRFAGIGALDSGAPPSAASFEHVVSTAPDRGKHGIKSLWSAPRAALRRAQTVPANAPGQATASPYHRADVALETAWSVAGRLGSPARRRFTASQTASGSKFTTGSSGAVTAVESRRRSQRHDLHLGNAFADLRLPSTPSGALFIDARALRCP